MCTLLKGYTLVYLYGLQLDLGGSFPGVECLLLCGVDTFFFILRPLVLIIGVSKFLVAYFIFMLLKISRTCTIIN